MLSQRDLIRRIDALAGKAPRRAADVRALARFATNSDCRLAALGFSVRVDFDQILAGTRFEAPFGQSPFAFRRGTRFEGRLRENAYAPMFDLLRAHLGHALTGVRVANLRDGFEKSYRGMAVRARETEKLIHKIVTGASDAPNLIDGAVLARTVGEIPAYFEADAVAAHFGAPIHVGEIKSFPTVDGQADPEKVGAAISQVAIYILLLRDLVARLGGQPDLVSTDALLITPLNTGLRPTLTIKAVGREVDRAHRILTQVPSVTAIASALPPGVPTFHRIADPDAPEGDRIDAANALAEAVGTRYRPACLSACGLSRFCRDRAHAAGDPARVGGTLVRLLPGIRSLDRAYEFACGAPASIEEQPVADPLLQAARLLQRLGPDGGPA